MSLSRRIFLKNAAIVCAAPAIVRAESIMRISPEKIIITDYKWSPAFDDRVRASHLTLCSESPFLTEEYRKRLERHSIMSEVL